MEKTISIDIKLLLPFRYDNKTHTYCYPSKPNSIWRIFLILTEFGYEFEFSPISKHGYGTGNGYIGTQPEPIPKTVPNVENYLCWYVMLFCLIIVKL